MKNEDHGGQDGGQRLRQDPARQELMEAIVHGDDWGHAEVVPKAWETQLAGREASEPWRNLMASMGIMAVLGSIFSWSIFTQPLIACFGWSSAVATETFSVAIFSLGLGALLGGRLQAKIGVKKVAALGIGLWGMGNMLGGLGIGLGPNWIGMTYGALGGFGVGMGYVASIAIGAKWFPHRSGFSTGLVAMGFAFGGLVYSLLMGIVPEFAALADLAASHAATTGAVNLPPSYAIVLSHVFEYSGLANLVIGGLFVAMVSDPPMAENQDFVEGQLEDGLSYTTAQMMSSRQFYVLWAMMFINITVGILIIGNAIPIMNDLTDASPEALVSAWGMLSLANVAGRFFWAALSEKIGARWGYGLIYLTEALAFLFIEFGHLGSLAQVCVAFGVIMFGYGGGFGVAPSFNIRYFGLRHVGSNYGALLTAWGIAGVVGPIAAAVIKDAYGSYMPAMPLAAVVLVMAMSLPIMMGKPRPAPQDRLEPPLDLAGPALDPAMAERSQQKEQSAQGESEALLPGAAGQARQS